MRNKRRSKLDIVYIIITIISAIGVLYAVGLYIKDAYLETISVETEAKIKSIDYNGNQRSATVTHEINNEEYILSIILDDKDEELTVNDTMTVKYNINNPTQPIYNEHLKEILIIIFISLIGTILTTNRTIGIFKDMKYLKNLKTNGITLDATITDAYVDVKAPKKHSEYPYRIRAKYLNPQDDKEYTFDSEYVYKNLKDLLSNSNLTTIKVYLDKSNTNIYYVDLDNFIKEIESTKVEHENNIQPVESKESSEEESK